MILLDKEKILEDMKGVDHEKVEVRSQNRRYKRVLRWIAALMYIIRIVEWVVRVVKSELNGAVDIR